MRRRGLTSAEANLGRMIRARRVAQGLAQLDLAQAAGVSIPTVHLWESGARRISAINLYRLGRRLQTPMGWFFGRDAAPLDPKAETDYAAAAEAMVLCPEVEAIPRLEPAQLAAVRSLIAAIAPPLADRVGGDQKESPANRS